MKKDLIIVNKKEIENKFYGEYLKGRAEALREVSNIIDNSAIVTKACSRAIKEDRVNALKLMLKHYRAIIKEKIAELKRINGITG